MLFWGNAAAFIKMKGRDKRIALTSSEVRAIRDNIDLSQPLSPNQVNTARGNRLTQKESSNTRELFADAESIILRNLFEDSLLQ